MTNTMRAAVLAAPLQIEIQNVPIPTPQTGEVRVKLEGCGVCASNLSPWEGQPWFTYPMEPGALGHEGWGVVDAIGPPAEAPSPLRIGDRVAMLSGHAYAEYDVAPVRAVVRLPDAVKGQPFPGEPLGCAMNIFRRSGIQPGQTVAIVGIGFLGALLTRLASHAGARVIAISRRPFSLEIAKREGAAETIPLLDHWQIIERVKELTNGVLCDVVVEAIGMQWPLDLSGEIVREMGRMVIAGYHQDGLRQVNMQQWNWKGLDVINSHEREEAVYIQGIQNAAEAVASGVLDPKPLMTHTFPLERLGDALNATRDRPDGFLKALVTLE